MSASLAIEVDSSLPGSRVVRVLDALADERGLPMTIVVDNGAEFTSNAFDQWAHRRGVHVQYIDPGKPVHHSGIAYLTPHAVHHGLADDLLAERQRALDAASRRIRRGSCEVDRMRRSFPRRSGSTHRSTAGRRRCR